MAAFSQDHIPSEGGDGCVQSVTTYLVRAVMAAFSLDHIPSEGGDGCVQSGPHT